MLGKQARAERVRQRTKEARMRRQATVLRAFWQTHHGMTWQDGAVVCSFLLASVGAWQLWPHTPDDIEAPSIDSQ